MYVILISKAIGLARVNEGSHSFTCHPHVYPHMQWAILPLLPGRKASPHFGLYSFPVPLRVGGWVGPETRSGSAGCWWRALNEGGDTPRHLRQARWRAERWCRSERRRRGARRSDGVDPQTDVASPMLPLQGMTRDRHKDRRKTSRSLKRQHGTLVSVGTYVCGPTTYQCKKPMSCWMLEYCVC